MNDLYNWFIPSRADWVTAHQKNDTIKDLAKQFYDKLDSLTLLFFIFAVVFGILGAVIYYYGLNNLPGRMYKISKWAIALLITVLISWGVALGWGYYAASSDLADTDSIIFRFTLPQIIWTLLVYFLTSVICCNVGKTNAYRFLAFPNNR